MPIYNSYRLPAVIKEKTSLMKSLEESFERSQMFTRVAHKAVISMETSSPIKAPAGSELSGCDFMFSSYVNNGDIVYKLGLSKNGEFIRIFSATINLSGHRIITEVRPDLVKKLASEELEIVYQSFVQEVMQYMQLICNSEADQMARVQTYLEQNFNIYAAPIATVKRAKANMQAMLEAFKKVRENGYYTEARLETDPESKEQQAGLRMADKPAENRVMGIIVRENRKNADLEIIAHCIPALKPELDTAVESCVMGNISQSTLENAFKKVHKFKLGILRRFKGERQVKC